MIEEDNPWSYIGYWGDHQIIYLLKLLELSRAHHPGKLEEMLSQRLFAYANVSYMHRFLLIIAVMKPTHIPAFYMITLWVGCVILIRKCLLKLMVQREPLGVNSTPVGPRNAQHASGLACQFTI